MLSVAITVVVSLILSAFFSGMEIAFLSSNKLKLEIERKRSRLFGYIAGLFAKYPGQYITTILVGNNVALVVYSLQMSVLIQAGLHTAGISPGDGGSYLIETLVSTAIILFAAEFVPKAVVRLNPNFYYRSFALPVYFFYLLFYPVAKLTTLVSVGILKMAGLPLRRDQSISTFDREDLAHLLDEAAEDSEQTQNEKDIRLFQNALDFSDLLVRDCMVPRIDIEAVEQGLLGRRSHEAVHRHAVFPPAGPTATTSTTSSDTSTPRACSAIRARSERFSTRSTTCPRACRLRSC